MIWNHFENATQETCFDSAHLKVFLASTLIAPPPPLDVQLTTRNFEPEMEISNGKWQPKANNETSNPNKPNRTAAATTTATATQRNAMRGRPTTLLSICYWLPVVRYFITNLTESELFGVRVVEESERERGEEKFLSKSSEFSIKLMLEMRCDWNVEKLCCKTITNCIKCGLLYAHTHIYIRGVHLPLAPCTSFDIHSARSRFCLGPYKASFVGIFN